jgi:hypothetical protein
VPKWQFPPDLVDEHIRAYKRLKSDLRNKLGIALHLVGNLNMEKGRFHQNLIESYLLQANCCLLVAVQRLN